QVHPAGHDERRGRVQRLAPCAQRQQLGHVVAEDEGEQRDRSGGDHREARPCEQERDAPPVCAPQEVVVAARVRIGGGQLGVAQRAGERGESAERPGGEHPAGRAGHLRDERRRLEDPGADHDSDDDRDRVPDPEHRLRRGRRHESLLISSGVIGDEPSIGGVSPTRSARKGSTSPPLVDTAPIIRVGSMRASTVRNAPSASVNEKCTWSPSTCALRIVVSTSANETRPSSFWKRCRIVIVVSTGPREWASRSLQSPPALAGTTHRCIERAPMRELSSGSQSPIRNSCDTTRGPGRIASNRWRRRRFRCGIRYIVTTSADEKSDWNRSACSKVARSATPAALALRRESATIFSSYSMPRARAPKSRAAAMTILPSPEPRSTTESPGRTCASCSMRVTSGSGVGIQMTSLPYCPLRGTKSSSSARAAPAASDPAAAARPARATKARAAEAS